MKEFVDSLQLLVDLHKKYVDGTDEDSDGEKIREDLSDLWLDLDEKQKDILKWTSEYMFRVCDEGKDYTWRVSAYKACLMSREKVIDEECNPLEGCECIVEDMEDVLDKLWYGMDEKEMGIFNKED